MATILSILKTDIRFGKKSLTGRVRTRLTGPGWGFVGLIVAGFLISVNFSNNLIFAMTFLLVGIALVGWYQTRSNVARLRIGEWKVQPAFAGRPALYTATVDNPGRSDCHGIRAVARKAGESAEYLVAAGRQQEVQLVRQTTKRGVLPATAAQLSSAFPLGIFQTRKLTSALPEGLVYPAPVGEQPFPDSGNDASATRFTESGSYTDMRRYNPGDPMSRINWKAWARTDELYTKEFDGARGESALRFGWDDVHLAGEEAKLSQLCRWVLDAHSRRLDYGLSIPGTTLEPAGGEAHLHICLEALARYQEGL